VTPRQRSDWLAGELRKAVDEQRFGEVLDRSTGRRIAQPPNVDVAVIELDAAGRPVAAAEVLLSKAYPRAVSVPVDANRAASSVRWRRWNGARWRQGTTASADVVKPAPGARYEFMSPYPASVFKLLVAFGVLRLVDQGKVRLDGAYAYRPRGSVCPAGRQSATRSVRTWLDSMLTYSDNLSTCALIKQLHDQGAVDDLNATLANLGLGTLQLGSTRAADGGGWLRSKITMTGLDTARLLLLVSGAPGVLWRNPKGDPVTADVLSAESRAVFLTILGNQGLNHALSTSNWCGRGYPAQGIPQRVPQRWIAAATGTVSVHGRHYKRDVRPCNAAAEVTFAHKTGLVDDAGADAGIVTSLPGAPQRRYIVAIFSNLGFGFGDAKASPGCVGVCSTGGVQYSEKFARLGARIDALLTTAKR
jgi:beta-lactamase class A